MRVIHRVNLGDDASRALPGNNDDGERAGLPEDQGSSVCRRRRESAEAQRSQAQPGAARGLVPPCSAPSSGWPCPLHPGQKDQAGMGGDEPGRRGCHRWCTVCQHRAGALRRGSPSNLTAHSLEKHLLNCAGITGGMDIRELLKGLKQPSPSVAQSVHCVWEGAQTISKHTNRCGAEKRSRKAHSQGDWRSSGCALLCVKSERRPRARWPFGGEAGK